jgi:hypothetical protein
LASDRRPRAYAARLLAFGPPGLRTGRHGRVARHVEENVRCGAFYPHPNPLPAREKGNARDRSGDRSHKRGDSLSRGFPGKAGLCSTRLRGALSYQGRAAIVYSGLRVGVAACRFSVAALARTAREQWHTGTLHGITNRSKQHGPSATESSRPHPAAQRSGPPGSPGLGGSAERHLGHGSGPKWRGGRGLGLRA